MKVSVLSIWEQLGGLEGWSELAGGCDASPFTWPTICIPWWYEAGFGSLMAIAVEESGLLVGVALVFDRAARFGHHEIRFLGDDIGTHFQLLVADGRRDITALLMERLVATGWDLDLRSVPAGLAEEYAACAPGDLAVATRTDSAVIEVGLDSDDAGLLTHPGGVRTVTDPSECLAVLTEPSSAAHWGSGVPGSRQAAFFASAVDASVRQGRATLHLEDHPDAPPTGVLVLHGSETSAVWRHVGRVATETGAPLVQVAAAEASRRGSRRILWPDAAGVAGQPFRLSDLSRPRPAVSPLQRLTGLTRRLALSDPTA